METRASQVAEDLKDLAQPRIGMTWEMDQESDLTLYPSDPDQPAYFFITKGGILFRVSVAEDWNAEYRTSCGLPPGQQQD
jgi:hypothetical protein